MKFRNERTPHRLIVWPNALGVCDIWFVVWSGDLFWPQMSVLKLFSEFCKTVESALRDCLKRLVSISTIVGHVN